MACVLGLERFAYSWGKPHGRQFSAGYNPANKPKPLIAQFSVPWGWGGAPEA